MEKWTIGMAGSRTKEPQQQGDTQRNPHRPLQGAGGWPRSSENSLFIIVQFTGVTRSGILLSCEERSSTALCDKMGRP